MRFFRTVCVFRNWPILYLSRTPAYRYGQPVELRLRTGPSIIARARTSDIRTSRAIFVDQRYLVPPLELTPDAVVVDIGAHIGLFTLFAAMQAPRGRFLCVEPEPANFALLEENVRRNALEHVISVQVALAAEEGEREMFYPRRGNSTGGNSFYKPGPRSFPTRCTTLTRLMTDHALDRVDFLKLDCEAAEVEVLLTTPEDTLRRIRQIAMEIHRPPQMPPVVERLRTLGFEELPYVKANYRYFRRVSG